MRSAMQPPGIFRGLRATVAAASRIGNDFRRSAPILDVLLVFAAAILAFVLHFKLGVGQTGRTGERRSSIRCLGPSRSCRRLGLCASIVSQPARVGLVVRLFLGFSVVSLAMVMTIPRHISCSPAGWSWQKRCWPCSG